MDSFDGWPQTEEEVWSQIGADADTLEPVSEAESARRVRRVLLRVDYAKERRIILILRSSILIAVTLFWFGSSWLALAINSNPELDLVPDATCAYPIILVLALFALRKIEFARADRWFKSYE